MGKEIQIDIKPLSVNPAWKGQRFKTDMYRSYERAVLLMMPKITMPYPPFEVRFVFGFSNSGSDLDNPVKPLMDILQKKYGFNDRHVNRLILDKVIVPKGKEFVRFEINHMEAE